MGFNNNLAVLVGVIKQRETDREIQEYLDELRFLAETAGLETQQTFTQRMPSPHKRLFVGEGKLQEIKTFCYDNEIGTVIFDDELTPSQTRNIEKELGLMIHDRTSLILHILPNEPPPPTLKPRWSWPNVNTCCPA